MTAHKGIGTNAKEYGDDEKNIDERRYWCERNIYDKRKQWCVRNMGDGMWCRGFFVIITKNIDYLFRP